MGSHPTLDQQELAAESLKLDHRDWMDDHQRTAERTAEEAFDRLNPTFGVPADRSHPIGHRDIAQRERALALGVRVAVHDSARTTGTWSSGNPARTTGPPTPSTPPAPSPPEAGTAPERVGPER